MDDHEWESDLSIISMITDRTGQHEVLLPINQTNTISGKKIQSGQTSPLRKVSKAKIFLFKVSGCCYGYCDQFCDWWI